MRRSLSSFIKFAIPALTLLALTVSTLGQEHLDAERKFVENSEGGGYLIYLLVALVLGAAAFFLWRRSKTGAAQPKFNYENRYQNYYKHESYEFDGADAAKDLERLRKSNSSNAKAKISFGLKKEEAEKAKAEEEEVTLDTKMFQEKMRRMQYSQLPINSFSQLAPVKRYNPLPLSEDESLLNAIEQANEEYEEDEAVRELALRILAAFRTRNSVESLAQIALYDLSSNLRSKAVTTLTEFDHESVFETILLACADPTREVRAASARGLFRLSFDRAHAWKRIIEANDEFRMNHAARAATESGIVTKSFDRLVHEDVKVAYEAFALVSLLIRAGETAEIFEAIRHHKDERVKFALLHVLKVSKDERTLEQLNMLRIEESMPTDVADRVRDTVKSFEQVMA